MFSIGLDEPLAEHTELFRHSFVWTGARFAEGPRGLPEDHPVCVLLVRLMARFEFNGLWMLSKSRTRIGEPQSRLLENRLTISGWTLRNDSSEFISASKPVAYDDVWPFPKSAGIPAVPPEVLLAGSTEWLPIDRSLEERRPRAVPGERMVLDERVAARLATLGACAICFGRTHVNHRPGISLVGVTRFDASKLLETNMISGVFRGADAERAWTVA